MSMKIFDFHLHPGYDFHDNDTDPAHFVAILKADGICGCAGSFINRDMNRRPAAEFAWRLPQLNRQVWEFQSTCPGFFVPGIHIPPDFPELSCKEMEAHKAKGGILLGELVSYMMDYRYDHPNLPELLRYAQSLGLDRGDRLGHRDTAGLGSYFRRFHLAAHQHHQAEQAEYNCNTNISDLHKLCLPWIIFPFEIVL